MSDIKITPGIEEIKFTSGYSYTITHSADGGLYLKDSNVSGTTRFVIENDSGEVMYVTDDKLSIDGSINVKSELLFSDDEGIYFGTNKLSTNQWSIDDDSFCNETEEILSSSGFSYSSMSSDGKYILMLKDNTHEVTNSDNYGKTWTVISATGNTTCVSSNGKYQIYTQDPYFYISSDYGKTWTVYDQYSSSWYGSAISADGKYQAVSTNAEICSSSDYGQTFTYTGITGLLNITMSSDGKHQYAAHSSIYMSHDYGKTWNLSTGITAGYSASNISTSSNGKYVLCTSKYGLFEGDVYTSSDFGHTWKTLGINSGWTSSVISSDGKYMAINVSGDVYVSTDYGNTFSFKKKITDYTSEKMSMTSDGKFILMPTNISLLRSISTSTNMGRVLINRLKVGSGTTSSEGEIRYKDKYLWVNSGNTGNDWRKIGVFETEHSRNWINPDNLLNNTYVNNSDGTFHSYTGWWCSGYQKVKPSTDYTYWNNSSDKPYNVFHYYDEDKTWLGSNSTLGVGTQQTNGDWVFTTPSGCSYIACNTNLNQSTQTFEEYKTTLMMEYGSVRTKYQEYRDYIIESQSRFKDDEIITQDDLLPYEKIKDSFKVFLDNNTIYIRTRFNSDKDLVQKIYLRTDYDFNNNIVDFQWTRLIDSGTTDSVSAISDAGELIHSTSDDTTPLNLNGTYIGAAHGCSNLRLVTSSSHGKDYVDIGSQWSDVSGNTFYIIRIVDSDTLWMLSEDANKGTSDIWSFKTTINGDLSHVSGATNTSDITVDSYTYGQMTPSLVNNIRSAYIDDKEITEDGMYTTDNLTVVNDYDVLSPSSVLDSIIDAVGTISNDSELISTLMSGETLYNTNITMVYDSFGSNISYHTFRTEKEIDLGYAGFIQSAKISTTTELSNRKVCIPKSLPITVDTRTWDLRTLEDFNDSDAPTSSINITTSYWENPNSPPDRTIEFLQDSNENNYLAFAMGYGTKSDGRSNIRKDNISNAWYLYTSMKTYPHAIDNKLGNVDSGTTFNFVTYRQYVNVSGYTNNATDIYYHQIGKDYEMFIDYHKTVDNDFIKLPSEFVGRSLTLVESSGITLNSNDIFMGGISITSTSNKSYAVFKISDSSSDVFVTPPKSLSLTEVEDHVNVSFSEGMTGYDRYEVWMRESGQTYPSLVKILTDDDIKTNMTVSDYSYKNNTTLYYDVFAIDSGNYSSSVSDNITVTNDVTGVTNVNVISGTTYFSISWENPKDRRLKSIQLKMDKQDDENDLDESNAVLIYEGLSYNYFYQISDDDLDKYFQFWVYTTTNTI